jgi:L-rhamnonate dehydratase
MNIKSIRAFTPRPSTGRSRPPSPFQRDERDPAGPLDRYGEYLGRRAAAGPNWSGVFCVAEAEDGTFGVGVTSFAAPVTSIINDHFAPHLTGQNAMATERCFDMMTRLSAHYGARGLTSYAISAVDLALWDLKGKLLKCPVYELLGGPQKENIFCYATGFHTEWYKELGFQAFKLPLVYGTEDGLKGLHKTEEMVAEARKHIGEDADLMLDCWMALDVETTVRLAEMLRPYKLRWLEDYLLPDDMAGFAEVRRRLPGQGLATGEHWYLAKPFAQAAEKKLVDIFQPDLKWCGGLSACLRICHIAETAGLSVIPHGGMGEPFGQHLSFAMPSIPWGEWYGGGIQPGEPIPETGGLPGTAVPENGYLVPDDAPGFGIDVDRSWLERLIG